MTLRRSPARLTRTAASAAYCALLVATSGCYRYIAGSPSDIAAGTAVRIRLSAVAVDRIRQGPSEQVALLDDFEVSGTVGRLAPDSIFLAVPMPVMEANVRMRTELRALTLARSDVQQVSLRRLDRGRTTWVGVGAGIGGAAIVWGILHAAGATGGLSSSGGTNEVRIPLTLRLRIP